MQRVCVIATLIAALALPACSASEGAAPTQSPSPTAQAVSLYQPPSSVCDAVSADTRKKYKLKNPEDRITNCSWSVNNPAKGPNGRKNQFTLTLELDVPTAADAAGAQAASESEVTPVQMAQVLLDHGQAELEGEVAGVTSKLKRSEPVNDLGDSAYSAVLVEEGEFGKSTAVVVALQAANAYIKVTYSGSDLKIDPSLPAGLQLVTTPVPPRRLKPAAEGVARDVLESLA